MLKKIIFPIIFISAIFLTQCDNDNDPISIGSTIQIVNNDEYTSATSDEFEFHNIYINDDVIYFDIVYGGGCGTVSAVLITTNDLSESLPPQLELRFIFTDNDDCEAALHREYAFSLRKLQLDDYSSIELVIEAWDNPITYNY